MKLMQQKISQVRKTQFSSLGKSNLIEDAEQAA